MLAQGPPSSVCVWGTDLECIAFLSYPQSVWVTAGTREGPVPEPSLHTFDEA